LLERGDRPHLGGGDDALATAPVNADLQHALRIDCRQTYCGYVGSYMHERT
jgi:hypothetical protein